MDADQRYVSQFSKLQFASNLCFKTTFRYPLKLLSPRDLAVTIFIYRLRGVSQTELEKSYILFLHKTFSLVFNRMVVNIRSILPQYEECLSYLTQAGSTKQHPSRLAGDRALKAQSKQLADLRKEISDVHPDLLDHMWERQFHGCKAVIKRCEFLLRRASDVIAQAQAKKDLAAQTQLASDAVLAAKEANRLSAKAAKAATISNIIAVSAAIIAALALVYQVYEDKEETAPSPNRSALPGS